MSIDTEVRANEMLNDKLETELAKYIDKLCMMTAGEVVVHAYEKVMKEDIVCYFSENNIPETDCMKILAMPYPLDALYQEWLKRDVTYMDRIGECMDDFVRKLH